jgi:hypothetical protein
MHKPVMTRIAMFALMLLFACSASQAAVMKAKISKIKGDVQVKATAKAPWKAAKDGDTITETGQIKTGAGAQAFVAWGGGSVVKVGPASQVTMSSLSVDGAGNSKSTVKLEKGSVTAKAAKLGGTSSFNVNTPTAVAGVRGTGFQCTETQVLVVDGNVAVTAGGVTVDLSPGMFSEVEAPGMPPSEPAEIPADMLTELEAEVTQAEEAGAEFIEAFGDEDMTMDEEELEELEAELESEVDMEDGMEEDMDMEFDDEDILDAIDTALDDSVLEDLVDLADDDGFLSGTGGIQGEIEF